MDGGHAALLPRWGPGFLPTHSGWYRVEYVVALVVILYALIASRARLPTGSTGLFIGVVLFWFLLPDLVAFLPIGLAMRGRGDWPTWGPSLYNLSTRG